MQFTLMPIRNEVETMPSDKPPTFDPEIRKQLIESFRRLEKKGVLVPVDRAQLYSASSTTPIVANLDDRSFTRRSTPKHKI